MIPTEQIRERVLDALPGAGLRLISNLSPSCRHSILVSSADALAVARFLRDDPELRFDYCSNVTGVDWPERPARIHSRARAAGPRFGPAHSPLPGYLEAVYHLFSMSLKHGPLVLRMRTENRNDRVQLPSLTPVWKSAEFQEREIYDLYGIRFTGHPDLRRLLMWEEFEGHPMRKDYMPPIENDAFERACSARERAGS